MKYISGAIGVLLTIASAFALWKVMPASGHVLDKNTVHLVYLFAGGIGFGMLLIIPTVIFATLKSLSAIVGQYIPIIGGRRAGDPPAPPTPPGGPT